MLDRTLAPQSGAIDCPKLISPIRHSLKNGMALFTLDAGDQPIIKLEIELNTKPEDEITPGAYWFTAKMLAEGSSSKSANEIASIFDFYGAHLDVSVGFDNISLTLYCLKKHFKTTVSLLHELLTAPVFPEKELDTLLNIRKQQIRLNKEKNDVISSKNIRKALYGDPHPYGSSIVESDLELINTEVLKKQYQKDFLVSMELFLCGDVKEVEINIVKEIFGQGLVQKNASKAFTHSIIQSENISTVKEKSMQSAIKFAWHIPNKKDKNHFKLLITNEILGGYFGSRLMKNLREEKGLTYGISSYPVFLDKASLLIIGTEVIADKAQLAIDEIIKEIKLLQTIEVEKSELDTVTNYMAGTFLSKISTPFHLMEKFQSLHNHALDYTYFEQYYHTLKTITPQDVIETANQYFDINKMSTAVVGKAL